MGSQDYNHKADWMVCWRHGQAGSLEAFVESSRRERELIGSETNYTNVQRNSVGARMTHSFLIDCWHVRLPVAPPTCVARFRDETRVKRAVYLKTAVDDG